MALSRNYDFDEEIIVDEQSSGDRINDNKQTQLSSFRIGTHRQCYSTSRVRIYEECIQCEARLLRRT